MAVRIAAHRAQRPSHWQTLEASTDAGAAILQSVQANPVDIVLFDCMTLLASNALLALGEEPDQRSADAAVAAEVDALLTAYAASSAGWLVVSNEVGQGIVPAYPLGRLYRDALGRANQRLAARAENVLLMVAGLPIVVKGTLPVDSQADD